jgi:hypothetical protein
MRGPAGSTLNRAEVVVVLACGLRERRARRQSRPGLSSLESGSATMLGEGWPPPASDRERVHLWWAAVGPDWAEEATRGTKQRNQRAKPDFWRLVVGDVGWAENGGCANIAAEYREGAAANRCRLKGLSGQNRRKEGKGEREGFEIFKRDSNTWNSNSNLNYNKQKQCTGMNATHRESFYLS